MNIYQCPECGYQYDETKGDVHEGYKPGTGWFSLSEDVTCPGCSIRTRDEFIVVESSSKNNTAQA